MSYSVPYTFIPGTKARAQEINANFTSITDSIDALDTKKIDLDLSNISETGIEFIKNNTLTRNIGEIIFAPIPITDVGVHLLDGTKISEEGIYKDFVKYIKKLYNEAPTANYFTDEASWQQSVTTYGSCGKFVYDSTNNTVRLPKVSDILQGTTDVTALGDLVEAGLPNITGTVRSGQNVTSDFGSALTTSGAFYKTNIGNNNLIQRTDNSYTSYRLDFSASRSSSLYKNNFNKVQPQTIKVLYYIVIANSTKTEIQVDIDEIATDLNGKTDVDLSNISASQSAKNEIVSWGMPDWNNSISYANNTNTNTAPSDGFIILNYAPNAVSSTAGKLQINGQNVASGLMQSGYRMPINGMFVINKNDTFKITAVAVNDSYTPFIYKFIPMKGAN